MEREKQNKLIGLGMMVVPVAVVGLLLVLTKFWLWLIIGVVCGAVFYVGLKLFKGKTTEQIITDVKEEIEKV